MNALEMMAIYELKRRLKNALDLRPTLMNGEYNHDEVRSKIKEQISECLKILEAIQENDKKTK